MFVCILENLFIVCCISCLRGGGMRPMYSMCAVDWLILELTSGGGGIRLCLCARLVVWVCVRFGMLRFCDG